MLWPCVLCDVRGIGVLSQGDFAIAIEVEGGVAEGKPASALRRSREKLGRGNQEAHLLCAPLVLDRRRRSLDAGVPRGDIPRARGFHPPPAGNGWPTLPIGPNFPVVSYTAINEHGVA